MCRELFYPNEQFHTDDVYLTQAFPNNYCGTKLCPEAVISMESVMAHRLSRNLFYCFANHCHSRPHSILCCVYLKKPCLGSFVPIVNRPNIWNEFRSQMSGLRTYLGPDGCSTNFGNS